MNNVKIKSTDFKFLSVDSVKKTITGKMDVVECKEK
jgi:hypothetical protein